MKVSGKSFEYEISFAYIFKQLLLKLFTAFIRLIDIVRLMPIRIYRMGNHIVRGIRSDRRSKIYWWQSEIHFENIGKYTNWWVEFWIYFIEIIGITEVYETLCDFLKFNTRPLEQWEKELAYSIFGEVLHYKRIRLDEMAFIGPKQTKRCYVSFYTINSWGAMENSIFIHELIHVWQYQQMGAVYIWKALRAQKTKMGYNYGGVSALKSHLKKQKTFFNFNLEQQGDIVADYYRIKEGYSPHWGHGKVEDLPVYHTFIRQMKGEA